MDYEMLEGATLERFMTSRRSFYIMKDKVCLGTLFIEDDRKIDGLIGSDEDIEKSRRAIAEENDNDKETQRGRVDGNIVPTEK